MRWLGKEKIRLLIRGQKGISLIETVIALALLGIIGVAFLSGLTTTSKAVMVSQESVIAESLAKTLLTIPQRTANQGIVLQQVQNVGYWLSRDVQMARSVNSTDPNRFLTLGIPVDTEENNDYSIVYLFNGSKLKRQVYDSGDNLTSETFIADYIDTDNTIFSALDCGSYRLTVRAVKDTAQTRSYEIKQRLSLGSS